MLLLQAPAVRPDQQEPQGQAARQAPPDPLERAARQVRMPLIINACYVQLQAGLGEACHLRQLPCNAFPLSSPRVKTPCSNG